MRWTGLFVAFAAAAVEACGGQQEQPSNPYVLQATGGTYNDGSGLLGIAALATLRDSAGTGPAAPWTGSLSDGTGPRASATYADPSVGSYAALWWRDVPYATGPYGLSLQSTNGAADASFSIADAPPLASPQVVVSTDGTAVSWSSIPGAASLECRISTASGTVASAAGAISSCAIDALADGSYAASVLAYSSDLATIASDRAQRPSLPTRFDVSEGRLSFLRAGAAPVVVLAAVGGALGYGLGERTLATWLSIQNADGTPTANAWAISITGPGISDSSPLTFTYPANFSRLLVWSYDQPATAGLYSITATSTGGTIAGAFSVGTPRLLDIPTGITANAGAQGSASMDWTPVAGAQSYLVSIWQGAAFVTSQWVSLPSASFPQDTFIATQVYDVYVAATDANMTTGARPAQVSIAENTMQPAGFQAR